MNPSHAFHRCFTLLVLAVASVAGIGVRAVELTPNSPFAPLNSNSDLSAAAANSPLELHGILSGPDGYKFNLCDQSGHINVWIGLNAAGQPFVVRAHDAAHNRVTVEYQGRELTLSLAQPRVGAMSMQQAMRMPMPMPMPMQQMPMMGPPQMMPGMGGASPADERMRLERIAEEIRRRRAMRAQAQQQYPPGVNQPYPQAGLYPQAQPYPQAYPQAQPYPQPSP